MIQKTVYAKVKAMCVQIFMFFREKPIVKNLISISDYSSFNKEQIIFIRFLMWLIHTPLAQTYTERCKISQVTLAIFTPAKRHLEVHLLDNRYSIPKQEMRFFKCLNEIYIDILNRQKKHSNVLTMQLLPWLRQSVTSLSPWRPRFAPGSVHVAFAVNKVALE
jgi:hypothetical protein